MNVGNSRQKGNQIMRSASAITENIISSEKEQKFQRMMKHQEEIVEHDIRQGMIHGNCTFVFSDRGAFYGIAAPWYDEFYNRAKRECEDAGYTVSGSLICW